MPPECSKHTQEEMKASSTNHPQGPVALFWDIENCPVPADVRAEDVAGNVRMALRVHPIIDGAVTMFAAYGDFNTFPRRLREGCQRTGVKLIDVPNSRKDAADKAILIDMFLFALDNHPPSTIILVSGDVDFAPALHILGQRGCTIILVIPSSVRVSSALSSAGRFVWDWPSLARGEGFVPAAAVLVPPQTGPSEVPSEDNGCPILTTTFPPREQNDLRSVQPGDINSLKVQLINLLETVGGRLRLTHIPAEYRRIYNRPLRVSEYGASKLVKLLHEMSDAIAVDGKGKKKFIRLRSMKSGPFLLSRRYKTEKQSQEDGIDTISDDGMGITGGSDGMIDCCSLTVSEYFDKFKYELQEILVSYSCRIFLGFFEEIYLQRYKRQVDYPSFGVNCLKELLDKVRDIAVVQEEPVSKRKFLVAVGS